MLSAEDMNDLALFVAKGQVDVAKYVDAATKKPKGDAARARPIVNTLCAACHGKDGKKLKGTHRRSARWPTMPPRWLHKILNGQPGEAMPALRALDPQISADIALHLQALPK